jgi:hypothetical protein
LRHQLRFGGDDVPEYMCGCRLFHLAGQSPVQSELHLAAARLQATVLGPAVASRFPSRCREAESLR